MNHDGTQVYLRSYSYRIRCEHCKAVHTNMVPWASHGSSFTLRFEETVAWLALQMDKTVVFRFIQIAWATAVNTVAVLGVSSKTGVSVNEYLLQRSCHYRPEQGRHHQPVHATSPQLDLFALADVADRKTGAGPFPFAIIDTDRNYKLFGTATVMSIAKPTRTKTAPARTVTLKVVVEAEYAGA